MQTLGSIPPQASGCVKERRSGQKSLDISLPLPRAARENAGVVVQCPTCSSKFRIADEKVTDRGVRVRCTSCKNVFQVRKSGLSPADEAEAPKPAPSRPSTGPRFTRPPAQSKPAPAGAAAARRVETEDLFGMAELTGDAPSTRRFTPATAKPVIQPLPSFDDIDLEAQGDAQPLEIATERPPSRGEAALDVEPLRPPLPPAPLPPTVSGEHVMLGAFKASIKDPFDGMDMGQPGTGVLELATQPKKDKLAEAAEAEQKPARVKLAQPQPSEPPAREPEPPQSKTLTSAVLTGALAAAVVIAAVAVSALRGNPGIGWFGFGAGGDLVATRVVNGVYQTASGKQVFYVRGRVENRGPDARGPIRVVAEVLHDGAPESRAEAVAGAEPTPEDVYSLKSAADAEKLTRTLDAAAASKKAPPGGSLPFFAVIAEPPPDLRNRTVRVRFETVDSPAQAKAR
jgi:predicted Zn finger-like uncharacterized protein